MRAATPSQALTEVPGKVIDDRSHRNHKSQEIDDLTNESPDMIHTIHSSNEPPNETTTELTSPQNL